MSAVRIALLGGFAAEVEGKALGDGVWRLRKGRELVKLLALADAHRLHREQAAEVLWPGRGAQSAANNLNQAVHAARRALGPAAIEVKDGLLRLHAAVDVEAFEAAADAADAAGDAASARAALALYGGELLPENRYDDWAEEPRRWLQRRHDELAERAAHGPPAARLPPLPAPASSFVGRGRELAALAGLLARTRLLTLAGPGGAGKTRLALELARRHESDLADGVALVELGEVERGDHVAATVAAGVDVRPMPGEPVLDALARFLAPRSLLLLVDNCEHVLDGAARTAAALLAAAPHLVLVATSREPLRLPGEVVFRVPSLALPGRAPPRSAADLLRAEAVGLFAERARAADPAFRVDAANAAAVAAICRRLDGLPLALELAAARMGALAPDAMAARLDDRFRLLRGGSAAAPTRQQTLAATLDWSHELLDEQECVLFRRLAVFPASFELSAAEAVHGAPDTADVLARLVEKSLVAAEDGGGARRYRLLETVRLYAGERLAAAGERDEAAQRHAAWALAVAEATGGAILDTDAAGLGAAHDTLLATDGAGALRLCVALAPAWIRRIDLAEAHERLAAALAVAPEPTTVRAQALLAAAAVDYRAGDLERVRGRVAEARALAHGLGDAELEWEALQMLGEWGVASDRLGEAQRHFRDALAFARRHGLEAHVALGVYSLGACRWFAGEPEPADELLAESGTLFERAAATGAWTRSPLTLTEFRSVAQGRPGLRVVFEDTLQPFVPVSCEAASAHVLASRAAVARVRGDGAASRALLQRAAAIFTRLGDDRGRSSAVVRLAYVDLDAGDVRAARAGLRTALELRRAARDRRGVGMVLSGLAHVETVAHRYAAAERYVAEACELFRRAGDRWGLASSLWRVADLAVARGRPAEARAALEDALAIVAPTTRARWQAHTLARLAEALLLEGRVPEAVGLLNEAQERYAAHDDAVGVLAVADRLARLAGAALEQDAKPAQSGVP